MKARSVVNLVVYNIAKTVNWICLIAYLFIIAFWIYQFLKKEQMVKLLKQLDAIITNKGVQGVISRLSKNMSFISAYGWFEFIAMIAVIIIGFTLRFKNGFDIGVILNDIVFLVLSLTDFILKIKMKFLFKDVQAQLKKENIFARIEKNSKKSTFRG